MKIAVFSGPTGGHFFPALAFAEAFKKRHSDARILLVTGKKGRFLAEKCVPCKDLQFEFLPDFPLPRPRKINFIVAFLPFLIKLIQAFIQSGKIISRFQPNLCVGFGSYVAFPGIWVGRKKKIPTLIHEQNQRVGRANAWLGRWSDRMAVSFKNTSLDRKVRSFAVTGLPLRASLVERALNKASLSPSLASSKLKILIVGGSQGSQSLNRLWGEALTSLNREEKSKIAVIHITGDQDFERIKTMYFVQEIEAKVFAFYERMEELYSEAHLAIARAGAATLFELALFEIPAIIFPYPYADAHQEHNARSFEKEGGVVLLWEKNCTGLRLKEEVFRILDSPLIRSRMAASLRRLAQPQAAEALVDIAEELLLQREACLP